MNTIETTVTLEPHTLSIHIMPDGMSVHYPNSTDFQLISFQREEYQTPTQFKEKVASEFKKIKQNFQKVRLIFSDKLFTLVPNQYFKEELASDFIEFNSFILPNDPIENQLIESIETQVVYSYAEEIEDLAKVIFPNATLEITHSAYQLISKLISHTYQPTDFYIWFDIHHIECVVFKNKKLTLYNIFEVQTTEDILYYILFVAEQLKIDVNDVPVTLLGNTSEHEKSIEAMKKYIRFVQIGIENQSFLL